MRTPAQATGPALTIDELRAVFAETTIGDAPDRAPGRLNLNTVSEELLRQLLVADSHASRIAKATRLNSGRSTSNSPPEAVMSSRRLTFSFRRVASRHRPRCKAAAARLKRSMTLAKSRSERERRSTL